MAQLLFRSVTPVLLLAVWAVAGCHTASRRPESEAVSSAATPRERSARVIRLEPKGGIGFDDLLYSPALGKLLAPAGGTGCLHLLEARSPSYSSWCHLGAQGSTYAGGHGQGFTSADSGAGLVFAIDRDAKRVVAIEPGAQRVVSSAALSGSPDYVRWVEAQDEVWVTEPDATQIEVFALRASPAPTLIRTATVSVQGGPESLVVAKEGGTAYSHLWKGQTVELDTKTHAIRRSWPNGCGGSRGIGLDSSSGLLFVGCSEGKVAVLDTEHDGRILDAQPCAKGVDIIAVNTELRHVYAPAASDGSVSVFGFGKRGKLALLGTFSATRGAHCVASDNRTAVWVCAPDQGSLFEFEDPFPRSSE